MKKELNNNTDYNELINELIREDATKIIILFADNQVGGLNSVTDTPMCISIVSNC